MTPGPEEKVWRVRWKDGGVGGITRTLAAANEYAVEYEWTVGCWDPEDPNRWIPAPEEPHVLQWGDEVTWVDESYGSRSGRFVAPSPAKPTSAVIEPYDRFHHLNCSMSDLRHNGRPCVLPEAAS